MVFPTLESMKAIESHTLSDDTQWLMYWVCYATMTSVEQVAWGLLIWIPFYRLVRVAALAWLALPQTRGAALIYTEFVRPFLLVAVEKARKVPALEPYASQFLATKASAASEAPSSAIRSKEAEHPAGMLDLDAVKREAMAALDETLEKAKAAQAAGADEDRAYQPMKSHAQ